MPLPTVCSPSQLFNDPLVRGRAVNNLVYWISQIIGSIVIGLLLDSPKVKRRTRAFLGWGILLAMVFIVHIWAYFYQLWVVKMFRVIPGG